MSRSREDLSHSLKWTGCSKILSILSQHSFNGKKGMGYRSIEPPCNPHSKYLSVVDNILCNHCGCNGHPKENCDKVKEAK